MKQCKMSAAMAMVSKCRTWTNAKALARRTAMLYIWIWIWYAIPWSVERKWLTTWPMASTLKTWTGREFSWNVMALFLITLLITLHVTRDHQSWNNQKKCSFNILFSWQMNSLNFLGRYFFKNVLLVSINDSWWCKKGTLGNDVSTCIWKGRGSGKPYMFTLRKNVDFGLLPGVGSDTKFQTSMSRALKWGTAKFHICGQIFFPAVWPAKSATKAAATSVQPRQDVQECVNVSWTPFRNIFKAVPGLQIKWPLLRIFFEYQSTLTIILKFLSHQELPQNDSAKMAYYWRKWYLCHLTVVFVTYMFVTKQFHCSKNGPKMSKCPFLLKWKICDKHITLAAHAASAASNEKRCEVRFTNRCHL